MQPLLCAVGWLVAIVALFTTQVNDYALSTFPDRVLDRGPWFSTNNETVSLPRILDAGKTYLLSKINYATTTCQLSTCFNDKCGLSIFFPPLPQCCKGTNEASFAWIVSRLPFAWQVLLACLGLVITIVVFGCIFGGLVYNLWDIYQTCKYPLPSARPSTSGSFLIPGVEDASAVDTANAVDITVLPLPNEMTLSPSQNLPHADNETTPTKALRTPFPSLVLRCLLTGFCIIASHNLNFDAKLEASKAAILSHFNDVLQAFRIEITAKLGNVVDKEASDHHKKYDFISTTEALIKGRLVDAREEFDNATKALLETKLRDERKAIDSATGSLIKAELGKERKDTIATVDSIVEAELVKERKETLAAMDSQFKADLVKERIDFDKATKAHLETKLREERNAINSATDSLVKAELAKEREDVVATIGSRVTADLIKERKDIMDTIGSRFEADLVKEREDIMDTIRSQFKADLVKEREETMDAIDSRFQDDLIEERKDNIDTIDSRFEAELVGKREELSKAIDSRLNADLAEERKATIAAIDSRVKADLAKERIDIDSATNGLIDTKVGEVRTSINDSIVQINTKVDESNKAIEKSILALVDQKVVNERTNSAKSYADLIERLVKERVSKVEKAFEGQLKAEKAARQELENGIPSKIQEALQAYEAKQGLANNAAVAKAVRAEKEERLRSNEGLASKTELANVSRGVQHFQLELPKAEQRMKSWSRKASQDVWDFFQTQFGGRLSVVEEVMQHGVSQAALAQGLATSSQLVLAQSRDWINQMHDFALDDSAAVEGRMTTFVQDTENKIFEGIQLIHRNLLQHKSDISALDKFTGRDYTLIPPDMRSLALNDTNKVPNTQPVTSTTTATTIDQSNASSGVLASLSEGETKSTRPARLRDKVKRDVAVKAEYFKTSTLVPGSGRRSRARSISSFKREELIGENVGERYEMIDSERFPDVELGLSFSALDLATFVTSPVTAPLQSRSKMMVKAMPTPLPKAFAGFKKSFTFSKRRLDQLAAVATTPLGVIPLFNLNSNSLKGAFRPLNSNQIVERQMFLLLALGKLTPSALNDNLNGIASFWAKDQDKALMNPFATMVEMSGRSVAEMKSQAIASSKHLEKKMVEWNLLFKQESSEKAPQPSPTPEKSKPSAEPPLPAVPIVSSKPSPQPQHVPTPDGTASNPSPGLNGGAAAFTPTSGTPTAASTGKGCSSNGKPSSPSSADHTSPQPSPPTPSHPKTGIPNPQPPKTPNAGPQTPAPSAPTNPQQNPASDKGGAEDKKPAAGAGNGQQQSSPPSTGSGLSSAPVDQAKPVPAGTGSSGKGSLGDKPRPSSAKSPLQSQSGKPEAGGQNQQSTPPPVKPSSTPPGANVGSNEPPVKPVSMPPGANVGSSESPAKPVSKPPGPNSESSEPSVKPVPSSETPPVKPVDKNTKQGGEAPSPANPKVDSKSPYTLGDTSRKASGGAALMNSHWGDIAKSQQQPSPPNGLQNSRWAGSGKSQQQPIPSPKGLGDSRRGDAGKVQPQPKPSAPPLRLQPGGSGTPQQKPGLSTPNSAKPNSSTPNSATPTSTPTGPKKDRKSAAKAKKGGEAKAKAEPTAAAAAAATASPKIGGVWSNSEEYHADNERRWAHGSANRELPPEKRAQFVLWQDLTEAEKEAFVQSYRANEKAEQEAKKLAAAAEEKAMKEEEEEEEATAAKAAKKAAAAEAKAKEEEAAAKKAGAAAAAAAEESEEEEL